MANGDDDDTFVEGSRQAIVQKHDCSAQYIIDPSMVPRGFTAAEMTH